ncbi:MAG: tetratricopeptide repeat protein, partial [Alphaproteobacteria bacterium]|nr:tetratricopeptide repeat protein [Alphaproteobacteria bacterium]
AVTYNVTRSGDKVEITFARPGTMTKAATTDANVLALEQVAGGTEPLKVAVTIAPGRDFRHFTIGSRVIIDVINPSAPKTKPAAQTQAAPTPTPTPAPVTTAPAPKAVAAAPAMPAKAVETVKEEALPEGQVAPEPAAGPTMDAHTISVTTTENVGMAVFERFGTLWIVIDRPGFTMTPQISGPEKEKFAPFKRVDLPNGTVFTTPLPEDAGAEIYGEGGGLVWRIISTPKQRMISPVLPQRVFAGEDPARGGTVKWPLGRVTKLIEVTDPAVGDIITVATVQDSSQNTGDLREFVDFTALRAPVGMAIRAKADDVKVEQVSGGVQISRPTGLALSRVKDVKSQQIREQVQEAAAPVAATGELKRIFDFDRWMMGGVDSLADNQHILLAGMGNKDKNGKVQDALALAKMNIANDRGQEALGFLSFAAQELPQIAESPEFKALRGAAEALAGKHELAWRDLNDPALKNYDELNYWRAYALAWLGDWKQAGEMMPNDHQLLLSYPKALLEKLGIKLAEIALRKNEVPKAEGILKTLERSRATLKPWTVAGLDYLTGQAARQKGEPEKTRPLWEPLITGKDDFYRARSGLALTMLELDSKDIDLTQAIDRLEGLRYAWRGDELEAQINYTLGKLYLQNKEYLKGFTILRDAAQMSPNSDIANEIGGYMTESFTDLMLNNDELSAEDAVMVYEEFKGLTPENEEGRKLVRKLAERMVNADLLTRAGAILQDQVDFKIAGEEQARTAMRLAAIYLLDNDPKPAVSVLEKAKTYYAAQPDEKSQAEARAADMMRARALSQMNQTEEAIALLNTFPVAPDVNRLRADISWKAGLWEDSAEALQDLILDEAIEPEAALTLDQADLILNRAVALNLSGNRVALTNLQKRFAPAMQKTARARLFDVVTRPRKTSIIADRETIEQIVSEVDMFKDFLEAYKQTSDLGN